LHTLMNPTGSSDAAKAHAHSRSATMLAETASLVIVPSAVESEGNCRRPAADFSGRDTLRMGRSRAVDRYAHEARRLLCWSCSISVQCQVWGPLDLCRAGPIQVINMRPSSRRRRCITAEYVLSKVCQHRDDFARLVAECWAGGLLAACYCMQYSFQQLFQQEQPTYVCRSVGLHNASQGSSCAATASRAPAQLLPWTRALPASLQRWP
jgi:hypothetical protein